MMKGITTDAGIFGAGDRCVVVEEATMCRDSGLRTFGQNYSPGSHLSDHTFGPKLQ